jgi:hypothetical protein
MQSLLSVFVCKNPAYFSLNESFSPAMFLLLRGKNLQLCPVQQKETDSINASLQ